MLGLIPARGGHLYLGVCDIGAVGGGTAAALPHWQRAIQLDPNFAMAYRAVGVAYFTLSEVGRGSEYYTRAFELREHTSEREKLAIATAYYENVTGQLEKAGQVYQEFIENYPRDYSPCLVGKRSCLTRPV